MPNFEPSDLIALIAVTACLVLIGFHRDGTISSILMTLIGYYFGQKSQVRRKQP